MIILTVIGIIALVFGFLLLFAPKLLESLSNWANKLLLHIDELTLKYRVGIGICFLGAGIFILFVVYYIRKIY